MVVSAKKIEKHVEVVEDSAAPRWHTESRTSSARSLSLGQVLLHTGLTSLRNFE